ncbi:hypothetical protein PTKIN_Ptkin13bG0166500 [Pterospermum kingtungense]
MILHLIHLTLFIFIFHCLSKYLVLAFRLGRTTTSLMDYPTENMNCILRLDTRLLGWRVMLIRVLESIHGITYNIDEEKGIVQISGRINPRQLMKTLAEVELHADLFQVDPGYGEMNIPFRHGYDYGYHGVYGYTPYGRPEYYYGYHPPQQRSWHPIYENYPPFSHYHQNYPYYEPQAQYFPSRHHNP